MYKIISVFLLFALIVAISVGGYKIWKAGQENIKLSNQLVESRKIEQETKSAYSIIAQNLSDLETDNKELQRKIDNRDEDVVVLGQANLKLKDQLFKIKNAKVTIVDNDGQSTNESVVCDIIPNLRVDFEKEQDFWKISGFCLTSPPSAEVSVSWVRALNLSFLLTKKNNQYRLYLDNNSPDFIAVKNLSLIVDPGVFEKKWYEKILLGADVGFSNYYPTLSVRGTYDIQKFSVGPMLLLYNGKQGIEKSVGVSMGWRPFN